MINVEGCIVSIDAMGCQREIAEKIISQGGDYLLEVKGNQEYLEQRTKEFFNSLPTVPRDTKSFSVSTFKTEGEGHGRKEKRKCIAVIQKEGRHLGVNVFGKWPSLNTLVTVASQTTHKTTGETCEQTRHYISSASLTAEQALNASRKHWEIENKLHWSLDVTMREDESRHRSGNSANNCAVLRKMVFNLLNMDPESKSLPLKQERAAGDWSSCHYSFETMTQAQITFPFMS